MAVIKLSESTGFQLIAPGTHIFKITSATYDADFGKLEIKMQTKNGQQHTERFFMTTTAGEANEKAIRAFSYFAKVALNDFTANEVDIDDLKGKFIKCEVKHVESTTINPNTNKPYINVQLGDKYVCDGFEVSHDLDDLDDL